LPARPAAWRTTGLLSLLALGVASPLAVLTLLGASAAVGQTARLGLAPGLHDEGVAVAVAAVGDAAAGSASPHGLALRRGCQWGQPGRKPYQGSVRQALQAAGLPEDVITQIEAQHRSGQKSGRLAISRNGIRHTGDGRVFPARGIALTYGMTLCQDATVNFAKGHVEMADLYEARDAQGKPHAVMVPDVCGNVSVLGAAGTRGGRGAVAGVSATLARRAQALAELADVLDPPASRSGVAADPGAALAAGAGAAGRAPGGGVNADAAAVAGSEDTADRRHLAAWPLLLGGGVAPGQAGAGASPAPLTALAAVTDLLVPPAAAAGVARGISRVTAAAGRSLEALGPGSGSGAAGGGGGASTSGGAQAVPEPGSLSISLLGLALLAWRMRRRG
jgi:hypothetical protein